MLDRFPYRARFDHCIVKASVDSGLDKYLSKASLEELKKLDIGSVVDLNTNIDLIGTVFNAAVINRLNRNDDGISTSTALSIKNYFAHKPHNLEHKSQRIVGHVVKAGWSKFGSNELLSDEQVKDMTEPFNLVLGGVVYRMVDEKFADLLVESSDETSPKYMSIATSWELAFTKYHIVLGSKNINEAEIITDEAKIQELKQYLKCEGGSGKTPDGKYIGRLIVGEIGDVLPVGMAYTTKPAAEVQGVATQDWTDNLTPEEKAELVSEAETSTQNIQENSSQTVEMDVKNNTQGSIPMKFKNIKELLTAMASKEGVSEASVAEFIAEQIEAKSKEWEAEKNASSNKLKETADKAATLEAELAKANSKIQEVTLVLENMQKEADAKNRETEFQTRMTALAAEFELSAKETALVAKQIKNLDETAYASWFENFSVFAEAKKKTSIAAAKEAAEAQIAEEAKKIAAASATKVEVSVASEKKEEAAAAVATAALEKTTETPNQAVANTTDVAKAKDGKSDWASAFGGDNIKITL